MSKYLFIASYTAEGIQGVIEAGATSRRDAVEAAAASVGGSLDSMYYAFGEDDAYVVVELPSDQAAAAVALQAAASGTVSVKTIKLLAPEEVDAAIALSVAYTPPGT